MHRHGNVYLTLAICAVAVFGILGYLIGQQRSDFFEEAESIKGANAELEHLAATDGLTGLLNARTVRERLQIELENAYRAPLACLIIDLDHFKKINDKHGHPYGDAVLVDFSAILKKAVRRIDVVGRLGGEEFIVILPDTAVDRALMVAERIRTMVKAETNVTASIGVAVHPTEELRDGPALLQAADEALYEAKKAGRNRVVLWQGSQSDQSHTA